MTNRGPTAEEIGPRIALNYLDPEDSRFRLLSGEITAALKEAIAGANERAARIADVWADTKPVLHASSNPATAAAIAAIVSDTGAKIAAAIRNLPPEHQDEGKP